MRHLPLMAVIFSVFWGNMAPGADLAIPDPEQSEPATIYQTAQLKLPFPLPLPGTKLPFQLNGGAAQLVIQGKQACKTGNTGAGLLAWKAADALYAGMSQAQRKVVVANIIKAQLPGIRVRVAGPDPSLRNIARVTARGHTIEMRISGYSPNPLTLPLTAQLPGGSALSRSYRTFTHFLCYEAEVMRIRQAIIGRCARTGRQLAPRVRQVLAGGQLEPSHYKALMLPYKGRSLADRLAASWMIERIAAEPRANPASCDMSIAATSKPVSQWQNKSSYDFYISARVKFLHDSVANKRGALRCGCR